jgi:transposase
VNEGRTAHSFVASLEASSADPEVPAKPQRRRFSAEDKKRILEEADAATGRGAIGALLRREGIYSSTLYSWRKERDAAVRQAFSQKRGPRPKRHPLDGENEKLRRQNQRLQEELDKAHIIIDVQKKVARLLGHPLTEIPSEDK